MNSFLLEMDFYLCTLESNKSKTFDKIAEDIRLILNNNKELLTNEIDFKPDLLVLQRKLNNALEKLNDADHQILILNNEKQQLLYDLEIVHTSMTKFENINIVNKNVIDELEHLLQKSKEENNQKENFIKKLKSEKKLNEEKIKKIEDNKVYMKLKCTEYEKLLSEYQMNIIELNQKITTSSPKQFSNNTLYKDTTSNVKSLHDEIMFINQQEEFHKVKKEYKELYDNNRRLLIEVSNLQDELEKLKINKQTEDVCCSKDNFCITV